MKLEYVGLITQYLGLVLPGIMFIFITDMFISIWTKKKEWKIRKFLLKTTMRVILCLATLVAVPSGYEAFILHHDYKVLFGGKFPANYGERMDLSPKIIETLLYRKNRAEEEIAAYERCRKNIALMPRNTEEEITAYISAEQEENSDLEKALEAKDDYSRSLAGAYYAGFEDEVLALPDIPFDKKIPKMPHRVFTE